MTDNKNNIVLIGMMGSGKSTIGHLLDQKLNDFQFLDIDKEIEKLAQKQITEIFTEEGEAHFRQLENEMVEKYAKYHNQVISTGGGIVENIENIELLKNNGVLFYLSASAKVLYERVKTTTNRPLLKGENPEQRLRELVKKREPFYKMADFEINTEKRELLEIVNEIIEKYESIEG